MTQKLEIYKCMICDNVIEITHCGEGTLVCCEENMHLMKENIPNEDNAHFAHIEILDDINKKIHFNHPMTEEHHIEYVEIISNDKKYLKRKYFEKEQPCEFSFKCECKQGFYVRLYCNKDGVWVNK